MTKIFVTGAGGYIGSTLVELLLDAGYSVVACDRFFFGIDLLDSIVNHPNIEICRRDIRDLTSADFQGVDAVCDLAALSNDPLGEMDPDLTFAINHRGRVNVAQAARDAGVTRYVLASSCSVYGHGANGHLDENSPARPLTTYAKANLQAEVDTLALAAPEFTVTVLRQATVFGLSRRMRFDLAVNVMTKSAVERGRITVLGGGQQWRPFVHVRDVARAFMCALETPRKTVAGQVFNIGTINSKILSLAYVVRENLPFPVELEIIPDDPDRRDYNVSFDKATEVLGFAPTHTVADGVHEIYEALKRGEVLLDGRSVTVSWYRNIIEAKRLVDTIMLDGRLV